MYFFSSHANIELNDQHVCKIDKINHKNDFALFCNNTQTEKKVQTEKKRKKYKTKKISCLLRSLDAIFLKRPFLKSEHPRSHYMQHLYHKMQKLNKFNATAVRFLSAEWTRRKEFVQKCFCQTLIPPFSLLYS